MVKAALIGILLSVFMLASPAYAWNLFGSDVCSSKDASGKQSSVCKDAESQTQSGANPVTHTINVAAAIIALIAGVVAVIMIIIAGFTMVTSAGNSEQVTNARRRIVSAVVGLIIVALAWTITRFVVDRVIQ